MSTKGRPFSASSSTAYFGSRSALNIKNLSMNPKVSNYQNDGYGRDTYIKIPNGGFRQTWTNNYRMIYFNKKSMNDYLKSTNINPKFPIYKSNGWGRDSYIYNDCGGFYHTNNFPHHFKEFFGKLRKYDYNPFVNESFNQKKYDYSRYVRLFKSSKQIEIDKKVRKLKKDSSDILSISKRRWEKILV